MTADPLAFDAQLCFPLYAAARALQRRYRPLLAPLGITYPQYLVLLVLWEAHGRQQAAPTVSQLGTRLHLDSGTLTPLLKRLERDGLVTRQRSEQDHRVVHVVLTQEGRELRSRAESVPGEIARCLVGDREVSAQEVADLRRQLYALVSLLSED